MTAKINQHLLPRVYLRAFTDSTRPADHPPDTPFNPPIWLIPRDLDKAGRARDPKKAFRAKRFYTLRDDDPERPVIEEGLSRVESAYAGVLRLLGDKVELSTEQLGILTLFIGTLWSRQPSHLDHWQTQFGELERLHRAVERSHTGREKDADRVFWMKDEMSRRLMFEQAASHAKVVGPDGWLLSNQSSAPFLTSDQPVTHQFLHPDELMTIGFPAEIIRQGATRADRDFFSYCALSPHLAFVSSPLLQFPRSSLYRVTHDARVVMMLNGLMRQLCNEFLVSPVADPFGALALVVRDIDALLATLAEIGPRAGILLYTNDNRFHIPCSIVLFEDGPNPLRSRIRFRSPEAARYSALRVGTIIVELEAFDAQGAKGGMRGARIVKSGTTPDDDWLIELGTSGS